MPRACSFGCTPSGASMHSFPDPNKFPERFKVWVTLVGGKLETDSDVEFFMKKKVCDRHFTDRDRNRYNRLNALAVPSLYLTVESRSSLAVTSIVTTERDHSTVDRSVSETTEPVASHSSATTSACIGDIHDTMPDRTIAENTELGSVPDYVMMDHSYSVASKNRRIGSAKRTAVYENLRQMKRKINQLRSEICRLRKKGDVFQTRLKKAEKITNSTAFQNIVNNMTKPSQLFVHMQLQTGKKPKGRRFTVQEKILALSLYKKSPKCYTLLHKYFTLPSTKAMKRLLSQIKLAPGLNPIIFEKIKKGLEGRDISDRLCNLMFDEMSLSPQVFFNSQKDVLEGFATNNDSKFADHALVFMVKGLKRNFKQPIAYYFTSGLKKFELKELIKTVITHAHNCGLIITSMVCDQCAVNVGAVTELIKETKASYLRLGKEWRYDFFSVNGRKVIPLYDAPHLIKGIRNNLLNKDMIYTYDNDKKIVKWEYYQQVYAADKAYGELRLLNKLTEEHVNPEKINKMRVKLATQIFSHSVAVVTEHLCGRGDLPEECRQLIKITLLLDNLFDTLNASTFVIPNGKIYKGPVKKNSPHHQMWCKAKETLKSVKFIEKVISNNKIRLIEKSVPSVSNLIKTIEGMEALWIILSQKYKFDAMLTRNFNQDPIENFFGNIRSCGARNNAPNTGAFEGAFKSLLLNNYNALHSSRANCEEDSNECLQNLDFFLKEKHDSLISNVPNEEEISINEGLLNPPIRDMDPGQRNYVCGWVLTKCLKNVVKTCQNCRQTLLDRDNGSKRCEFIKKKEYFEKKIWLCYPSTELENCFQDLQHITTTFLLKNVPKRNLKHKITQISDLIVNYPFNCPTHMEQLKKYFVNTVVNILIYSWCRSINRILSGKITYEGEDEIKTAAQQYYNKRKHYKNKK